MRTTAASQAKSRSISTGAPALLAAGVLILAGCGSSSSGTSSSSSTPASTPTTPASSSTAPAGAQALSVAANPQGELKYEQSTLSAKAGKVSISFTNQSPLAHNLTIESAAHVILGGTPTFQGGARRLTLDLKPGTYKYFCTVPGHRMAGMEGTLTVQ